MRLFSIAFPIVMILAPLATVLAVSLNSGAGANAELARRRLVALAIATFASLAVFAACWALLGDLARFAFVLFFPLFFIFALPALVARNPDWGSPHPAGVTTRSATLVNRERERLVPSWVWVVATLIGLGALVAIALRPLGPRIGFDFGPAERNRMLIALGIELFVLATIFVPLGVAMPMLRREPEPLDAAQSPELAAAYARLRRFKASAFVWLFAIGMNGLFGLGVVLFAWSSPAAPSGTMLGVASGFAGAAIGIAGSVVGVVASVRRVRINAMLRELAQR